MRPLPIFALILVFGTAVVLLMNLGGDDGGEGVGPGQLGVVEPGGEGAAPLPDVGPAADDPADSRVSITDEGTQADAVQGGPAEADEGPVELFGEVVDVEGNPLEGVHLVFLTQGSGEDLWSSRGLERLEGEPRALTDANGKYRLKGVSAGGDHALYVHHPEMILWIEEGVTVGPFGSTEHPQIILSYGKRVRGVVQNEFDHPVEGARLHLDARWVPDHPTASLDRLSATTDEHGRYEILGVPDGKRCLTAEAEGFGTVTRIASLHFSDKTGQSHIVNFTLKGDVGSQGRVVDLEGNPVAGATVVMVESDEYRDIPNAQATTAADGTFEVTGLPFGRYRTRAVAEGYLESVQEEVIAPITDLVLTLTPRPMIRGTVVDAEGGTPVTQGTLRLRRVYSADSPTVPQRDVHLFQDAKGAFAIPAVDPQGTWVVEADAPGYAPTQSASFLASKAQGVDDVVVALTRGGGIRGRLVDPEGKAVRGGLATSRDATWSDDPLTRAMGGSLPSNATVVDARADENGEFELLNLHPGTYQVVVSGPGLFEKQVTGIVVEEGGLVDLGDVALEKAAALQGVLYDVNTSPISRGIVFLSPTGQATKAPMLRTRSLGDGSFRFRDVIPGTYVLSGKPPTPTSDPTMIWPNPGGEQVVLASGVQERRDVRLMDWTKPAPPTPKPPTGNVGGKVLDAEGVGVIGAALELVPRAVGFSPTQLSKSGREGEFVFLSVPPGEYALYVIDHPETEVRVDVVADQWVRHDLQLGE